MSVEIKTNNLTKMFKDKIAVNSINLEINKGELFALLGPNGAGKTTLIKMLCCLLKPTSGSATLCGYDIMKDELKVKENIAVSPQETAVARNLTVKENLEMIKNICGIQNNKIQEIAKKIGLDIDSKLKAKNLSGGNQRKLSLAMALLSEPKVLFLDEPTLGLDIEARYDLWEVIKELKGNTTIILTTHYLEEADALADRIGIIKNGKIIELDTSKNLKKKYAKEGDKNTSLDTIYMNIVRGEK